MDKLIASARPDAARIGCRTNRLRRSPAMQRGQTAVIALFVMLLLAFIGALFVSIVARNLVNAHHQVVVVSADYYAQSGIQYADTQLTNSDLGADWRPIPTQQLAGAPPLSAADPDYAYLLAGFTRYNMTNGRFLLRLTYVSPPVTNENPFPTTSNTTVSNPPIANGLNPYARYIKIESIGREGVVDPTDPTTFNAGRQNSALVAYKAIGITDYARFETNIDKRSDVMNIGVPSVFQAKNATGFNTPPSYITTDGIYTPGVFDFVPASTTTYAQYNVINVLGAPDAYYVEGAPGAYSLAPNPNAGSGNTSVTVGTPPDQWMDGVSQVVAPGGGSFRANGTTRFFGLNEVYLNSNAYNLYATGLATTPANSLHAIVGMDLDDHMEIAGNLLLDNFGQPTNYLPTSPSGPQDYTLNQQDAALLVNLPPGTNPQTGAGVIYNYIVPSTAPSGAGASLMPNPPIVPPADYGFDTHGGVVRDGSSSNDVFGNPRAIKRLEPPVIDNTDPVTGLTRYRDMAINSPTRDTTATWHIPNPGQYGFGQIIYVPNTTDTQPESTASGASSSLVDEWLNRNMGADGNVKGQWNGGIYTPPAVQISIGDLRQYGYITPTGPTPQPSNYGIYLLRDDGNWDDPTNANPTASSYPGMMVSYNSLNANNQIPYPGNGGTPSQTVPNPTVNPNNDVIIVAEGNVRVSGCVSDDSADTNDTDTSDKLPRHITIVTYGTAYIDGSLLKGNPSSSIAILAHDYVCINTTQFTAGRIIKGKPDVPNQMTAPTLLSGGGIDFGAGSGLAEQFNFGFPATQAGGAGTNPSSYHSLAFYVAGQADGNGAATLDFGLNAPYAPGETPLTNTTTPSFTPISFGSPNAARTTIDLTVNTTIMALVESQPMQLWMSYDTSSTVDPVLTRAAILPNDVRIEAVLYAQTRSLFVIPGDWFNTSSDDDIKSYLANGSTTRGGGIDNTDANQKRFPFYGQPIDLKITIYGAVSEARPADIGAQNAWMQKWGWIPEYHGSLTELSGHQPTATATGPTIGLQIIYDPECSYPLLASPTGNITQPFQYSYLRLDAFGNPLPFVPRLPVCPGLLYSGEMSELPAQ